MIASFISSGKHFGNFFCELAVSPPGLWLEDIARKTHRRLNHECLSLILLVVVGQLCNETSEAEFDDILGLRFWSTGISKV